MSHVCGSFYRGLLPPSPRGDFARLVAPAPTSGPTRPTPGEILRGWQPLHPPVGLPGPHPGFLSFHDERNQRRARGCAPWTPLGGIIIPPAARTPQRGVAASPQKDSPRGRVGGGAGLCFPPRRIRGRAIKGRVITKPSLYLKTNSCNEGQNFSLYIPFYKIFFYKSWLLSLQKG